MEALLILGLLLFILFRIASLHLDRSRIEAYFQRHGETVVSIKWRPLRRGVLWETSQPGDGSSVYEVEYIDAHGHLQRVWCKTNLVSGIRVWTYSNLESLSTGHQPSTPEEKIPLQEAEDKNQQQNL